MKQTHRFARDLACVGLIAGTLSLWGCGSASTYDPITPTRIVAFGDALVDVGQTGRTVTVKDSTGTDITFPYRFTINTGTATNTSSTFIESLASYFGFASVTYPTTTTALPSTGAYSYGEFGALVSGAAGTKDARGCIKDTASATTAYCAYNLQAQIDLFLAKGTPKSDDLFVISIGTGDIMATGIQGTTATPYDGFDDLRTLLGGTLTATQINARMQTAADALAAQIKRLTDAGAKYVLIVGPPNVGRSPWAAETGDATATLLKNLSYNTGSGVTSMGSEGLARIQATFGNKTNNPVLFVEISGLVNTFTSDNTTYANRSSAICASTTAITVGGVTTTISSTTTDTAKSNGTGLKPAAAVGAVPAGRLSAALCTLNTVGTNNPGTFVYADGVNFTPSMQSQFYSQALARMRLAAWIN